MKILILHEAGESIIPAAYLAKYTKQLTGDVKIYLLSSSHVAWEKIFDLQIDGAAEVPRDLTAQEIMSCLSSIRRH